LGLNNGDGLVSIDFLSLVSPAPEPASWATMTLGFGAIGAFIRRRPRRLLA
jgi:hypothetical protein